MLLLHNYCAKIYSRSGLAAKHGIHVSGGRAIIDSDFLGPMAVWLINLDNNNSYEVKFHDRLAQMTFEPVTRVKWSAKEQMLILICQQNKAPLDLAALVNKTSKKTERASFSPHTIYDHLYILRNQKHTFICHNLL